MRDDLNGAHRFFDPAWDYFHAIGEFAEGDAILEYSSGAAREATLTQITPAGSEPIDVYNRGKMSRSFTHVSDIVSGIVAVLERKPSGRYEIYNLGGAETVPLTTFIAHIEDALGKKAKKREEGLFNRKRPFPSPACRMKNTFQ